MPITIDEIAELIRPVATHLDIAAELSPESNLAASLIFLIMGIADEHDPDARLALTMKIAAVVAPIFLCKTHGVMK